MNTIIRVAELVTRKYIKRYINKRFPLTNNTSISFIMIYSYQVVHESLDYKVFLVAIIIEGTKHQMPSLFTSLEKGVYQVQVNLKNSIELPAYHVIVILIVKNYSDCIIAEEVIAIMQDNRGEIGLVQKVDIDKAKILQICRSIFLVFLQ